MITDYLEWYDIALRYSSPDTEIYPSTLTPAGFTASVARPFNSLPKLSKKVSK